MAKPAASVKVCADVTFRLEDGGVLASNHRARRHVWLSLPLFQALAGQPAAGPLEAADRTRFSSADGLLADPTCLGPASAPKRQPFASLEEAAAFLSKRFIVVEDAAAYDSFFGKKTSLVDQKRFGTFHQQLGAELRVRLRQDPDVWWYAQKFDPATGAVRDNLYKFVQEAFLERFFASLELEGKTVLDFGCGSGMASRRFAAKGARVIGVDPNETLLGKAADSIGEKFTPVLMRLDAADPLAGLPAAPVDLVWLADVFMFYFHPQDAGRPLMKPAELLRRLTTTLEPDGRCVVMQPHGVFWLLPWLGDAERPYTVMAEYAERLYSVAPSLEDLAGAIGDAGLAIRRIHEPKPAEACLAHDARAYHFAREFPQWWVFDCVKV